MVELRRSLLGALQRRLACATCALARAISARGDGHVAQRGRLLVQRHLVRLLGVLEQRLGDQALRRAASARAPWRT